MKHFGTFLGLCLGWAAGCSPGSISDSPLLGAPPNMTVGSQQSGQSQTGNVPTVTSMTAGSGTPVTVTTGTAGAPVLPPQSGGASGPVIGTVENGGGVINGDAPPKDWMRFGYDAGNTRNNRSETKLSVATVSGL